MRLTHWLMGIGVVVAIGCLQVAQRNALFLQGYAIGSRVSRLHTEQTDVAWLHARVTQLSSPTNLARAAQERQLKLVAWSTLPSQATFVDLPQPGVVQEKAQASATAHPFVHVAAIDHDQPSTVDDGTSD